MPSDRFDSAITPPKLPVANGFWTTSVWGDWGSGAKILLAESGSFPDFFSKSLKCNPYWLFDIIDSLGIY